MQVPEGFWRVGHSHRAKVRGVGATWPLWVVTVFVAFVAHPKAMKGAKKSGPWAQISLGSVGFPGVSGPFLAAGSSMLTVHFLDSRHLLVTYGLRTLVPRLPDDPMNHDDRLVAGEVVDLPSGHVSARTEWHMHDHGRYLWKLGEGRFLIRIGGRLYTMDPLANLGSADAFARTLFPGRQLPPTVVLVSPDGGVVTLETMLEPPSESKPKVVVLGGEEGTPEPSSKTVIDFFRVHNGAQGVSGADFEIKPAGQVLSPVPMLLPIDADGYLWAESVDGVLWTVTFDGFGGNTVNFGKVESSCRPRLQMISRSEFLVLTCRGADDRIRMTSYGMDGHETWEEGMGDVGTPTFAFAPAAARFAMSSTHVEVATGTPAVAGALIPATTVPGQLTQEVRVYQNASGDLLLEAECTPVFKTAENFDLSSDGLMAVVVQRGSIAVYKLPAPGKRDLDDMAEVQKFAPPVSMDDVVLKRLTVPVKTAMANESAAAKTKSDEATAAAALIAPGGSQGAVRKRPTLLNPGEKPVFGSGNSQPN